MIRNPQFYRFVDLCSDNETYQDFFLETLDRTGHDRDLQKHIEKLAKLRKIDLVSLRDELRAAGLPTDLSTVRLNAFPAGEQHFVSSLVDEIETIEREHSIGGTNNGEFSQAARRAVTIDARRVPADLKSVVYLAQKWGIADDADRSSLINQASANERADIREVLSAKIRRRINGWIDSFPDASFITTEASHFMYLLEAYDEM